MGRSYKPHSTASKVYFIALGSQWNTSWKQAANQRAGEVTMTDTEQIIKDEASVLMETCSFNTNEQKQQ